MTASAKALANLRPFAKGEDSRRYRGGKGGWRHVNLRKVSADWIDRIAHVLFHEDEAEFAAFLADPGITAAERMVAKIVERVYKTGDPQALSILLDRFIGKVETKQPAATVVDQNSLGSLSDDELARREALLNDAGRD